MKQFSPSAIAAIIGGAAGVWFVIGGTLGLLEKSPVAFASTVVGYPATQDRGPVPITTPSVNEPAVDAATADAGPGFQPPPAWVPVYSVVLKPVHGTRADDQGQIKGIVTIETADPVDKVKDFYKNKLTDEGFELTVDKSTTRQFEHAEITGRKDGGKLTIRAIMHQTKALTMINVNYTDAQNAGATSVEAASAAATAASPESSAKPPAANGASRPASSLPVWVPVYPSVKREVHVTANSANGAISGVLEFETVDSIAKVRDFYLARLKEAGYGVESGIDPSEEAGNAMLKAKKDGGKFSTTIAIQIYQGATHVMVSFDGPS